MKRMLRQMFRQSLSFGSLDIPVVRLFRVLLRLRMKEEVMRLKRCMIVEQDRG